MISRNDRTGGQRKRFQTNAFFPFSRKRHSIISVYSRPPSTGIQHYNCSRSPRHNESTSILSQLPKKHAASVLLGKQHAIHATPQAGGSSALVANFVCFPHRIYRGADRCFWSSPMVPESVVVHAAFLQGRDLAASRCFPRQHGGDTGADKQSPGIPRRRFDEK